MLTRFMSFARCAFRRSYQRARYSGYGKGPKIYAHPQEKRRFLRKFSKFFEILLNSSKNPEESLPFGHFSTNLAHFQRTHYFQGGEQAYTHKKLEKNR